MFTCRWLIVILSIWVTLLCAIVASAGDKRPPEISPNAAIALLVDAYHRGPVADRVQIRVIPKSGAERRATAVLRVDRGDAAGFRQRQLRLELGSLLIHADNGMLLAISRLESRSCFEIELAAGLKPEQLAAVLPPLPLPQVAIALGDDAALATPLAYVRGVTWSSVESKSIGNKPMYAIKGQGKSGEVIVTIDQVTGRMRQFTADITAAGSEGQMRLEISSTPLEPGDPQAWALSSADRERVSAIDLLGPRAGDLVVGQRFPNLPILDATLAPFTPGEVFASATAPGSLVLVAFRPSADTDEARLILADAKAGIAALQGLGIKTAKGMAPLAIRPLAIFEGEDLAVERLAAWTARWDHVDQKELGQKFGSMLSTSSSGLALDRFGPGLAAALIVIGSDQRVLGVVPLDGRADNENIIRREFIAASGAVADSSLLPANDPTPIGPPVPAP